MNWPVADSAVTSTMPISTGCVKTSFHAASDSGGGLTPSGMARHTHHAATAVSAATSAKAQRQPNASPM